MGRKKSDQNAVSELTREGLYKENKWLWEENKKLKEFKNKREESMFYFKGLAERAEPINSKEAEELQKYKKLFEKLYREELYYLEEENRKMSEKIGHLEFDIEAWKKLKAVWEKKEQGMQRENDQLKLHIEAKDKAYESLLTDYNYLEARIKRMEKKFLEYVENHKKLEDELDDVIMNR